MTKLTVSTKTTPISQHSIVTRTVRIHWEEWMVHALQIGLDC